MTASAGESRGSDALAALTDLARSSVEPPTPVQLDRGLDALSVRLAIGTARRRVLLRWSLAGAVATLCLFGIFEIASLSRARVRPPAPAQLAYHIEGGTVVDGGYLREAGNGGIKLVFSEGTEFILTPGTRGRLRAVDPSGARIAIEQGTASFQVTPRSDARWRVDVGPFLVTVTGTVFAVSWDAATERFELRLRHGYVTVSGPVAGGDIALRAGQRLVVNLAKAETLITEQKPEESWLDPIPVVPAPAPPSAPVGESSKAQPPIASERPAARGAGAPAPSDSGRDDGDRRWNEALAAGELDRILTDVERAGVKSTLERASSEDLFTLATAARYRRRVELARDALLAERRRFSGSPRALDAAFLLGRLEEDSEHGTAKAVAWYEEYLTRAPGGTYASEALGRKMMVTNQIEGAARARPIAEEYLRRFPGGTYAGSARALERAP
jgi:hypothetical protein